MKRPVILLVLYAVVSSATAAILPEDRADALYHSYDGGGVTISGPSILVRKEVADNFSLSANYYVDMVSSASIDVVTTASAYTEERTENSLALDYVNNKTTMNIAFTQSEENDFNAKSMHMGVSQDIFGDLTTISLGYSQGWDEVGRRGDPTFQQEADRRHYRAGISQIMTKNLITSLSMELITDEGYLNNPYRTVRYIDNTTPIGYSYQAEVYPNTRTSTAFAFRARYFLPYRAALHAEYRLFSDSWGIDANTYEIGYTHPIADDWHIDVKYRLYDQSKADFYSDLYPYINAQNFLARDKELSTYSSSTIGVAVSYEFAKSEGGSIDKASVNFKLDHIQFDYNDFRDLTQTAAVGSEPTYQFSANVIQFYVSVWY